MLWWIPKLCLVKKSDFIWIINHIKFGLSANGTINNVVINLTNFFQTWWTPVFCLSVQSIICSAQTLQERHAGFHRVAQKWRARIFFPSYCLNMTALVACFFSVSLFTIFNHTFLRQKPIFYKDMVQFFLARILFHSQDISFSFQLFYET